MGFLPLACLLPFGLFPSRPKLQPGGWDTICGSKNTRILKSHFSLENVKNFLKANDLSKIQEIWLLHLSDGNSDAERFKREIQELTGKPVYVAAERRYSM